MNPELQSLISSEPDYRRVNREGWTWLSSNGCESSTPYGPKEFAQARRILDSANWLPWSKIRSVLCLACGGGQQGPLFASLGYTVTVVDLCPQQLRRDEEVSREFGLTLECVEADMLDLTVLHGRKYDLVYQPMSACYVPDVRSLYLQVRATLRPEGLYYVEHWNPAHLQLSPSRVWDGEAYRLSYPQSPNGPIMWSTPERQPDGSSAKCLHYIHSLSALAGGLCDLNFTIERFAELADSESSGLPGSPSHVARYIPPVLHILARYAPSPGSGVTAD